MKTKTSFLIIAAMVVAFTACNQVSYKKAKSGMIYKIIPGNSKDSLLKPGKSVKFNFILKYNDSVMRNSYTDDAMIPGYARVDISPNNDYSLLEILPLMKKGDSAVVVEMVDTLLLKGARFWPGVKKGDRLTTYFRIIDVFSSDSLTMDDISKEKELNAKKQMEKEKKTGEAQVTEIENYLKEKNINATKTKNGAFVQVIKEGAGSIIDSGKLVSVMYTGTLFSGEKFDSNVDSSFGHTDPLQFIAGNYGKPGGMIQGFDEAVLMMKKGEKARIYLPSNIAYGANPRPGGPVKPFDKLIFDVEITNVEEPPANPAPAGH